MGFVSWLKAVFGKETQIDSSLETLCISKTETPEKIIETKIKPIKIPTIVDMVDRLTSIFYELTSLKNEMVSKSWFESQYEDSSAEIIKHLNDIKSVLNDINYKLSNFTKPIPGTEPDLSNSKQFLSISDRIYNIIQNKQNVRYKDIISSLPFSDPTISKYLKVLLKNRKIKRIRIGKAVYYTTN